MTPNQVSAELRRIASKISASENPSRELVVQALKKIASAVSGSDDESSDNITVDSIIQKCIGDDPSGFFSDLLQSIGEVTISSEGVVNIPGYAEYGGYEAGDGVFRFIIQKWFVRSGCMNDEETEFFNHPDDDNDLKITEIIKDTYRNDPQLKAILEAEADLEKNLS